MLQLNKKISHAGTWDNHTMQIQGCIFFRWCLLFYHPIRIFHNQNSYMYNNIKNSLLILRNYLIQGVLYAY